MVHLNADIWKVRAGTASLSCNPKITSHRVQLISTLVLPLT